MSQPTDYLAILTTEPDDAEQAGVKGMRWGVRRDLKRMAPGERAGYVKAKDAKWTAKVQANPKLGKISKKAARDAKKQTKQLKKEFKDAGINLKKNRLEKTRYDNELKNILESSLDRAAYKVHKFPPSRINEVKITRNSDGTMTATITPRSNAKISKQQGKIARNDARNSVKHADLEEDSEDDFNDLTFTLTTDEEGYVDDITAPGDDLEHSDDAPDYLGAITSAPEDLEQAGVKGMKWGVRNDKKSSTGTSKKETAPAAKPAAAAPKGNIQDNVESSSARYDRLSGQARSGRASDMTEQDLKFYNARTDALAKINKMNEEKPGWLQETAVNVLQTTAKNQMQSIADSLATKYVGAPIIDSIGKYTTKEAASKAAEAAAKAAEKD